MLDDGDRILDLVGVALVAFILVGAGMVVVAGLNAGNNSGAPETDWTLVRVNDSHVQIGHVGGDSVRAANLAVTVDGTDRSASWEGNVSRGDVALVPAERGATVRLYWSSTDDDRILLETWPGGNGSRIATPGDLPRRPR